MCLGGQCPAWAPALDSSFFDDLLAARMGLTIRRANARSCETVVVPWRVRSPDSVRPVDHQPLTNIHDYWSKASARLRDSAKWMATTLGLALGAFNPLRKWKETVESQQDLYLPCGVKCLTSLRQAMIIDELTLFALANAVSLCSCEDLEILEKAQKGRAARLMELRDAACQVAVVGEFYRLRFRSSLVTYLGLFCGLVGTAFVIGAFIWR